MIGRRTVCALLGHRWVFTHITIPRRYVCATCGKVARG